ncbi:type II toxin-antitoxin system MqsA family antitoxin [Geobacter benzoatilyticus]|uniref:Type II toxin-antitoxin system MqsA family antitoxin n=1 Tax=Geobacter benzoatilyticus TaxID=2815309 RepID=A0ABX7Q0V4_9BACT|nr:type II toxin-antitoxin system MqsA family antitoxin [Geobacter benzoatilyticus]QSV44553.1 type II toxin-antitoxin system MqsA family antitoxin [Geobacter benzoatilyticus]
MMSENTGVCPLCGGDMETGKTTFTADLGFGVVVVRNVPATLCSQCGADWIDDATAARIEKIVDDARSRHAIVDITDLAA